MKAGILISLAMWAVFFAFAWNITGCAEYGAFKTGVATHGAAIADEALITARWMSCEAATVGAVRRKYGGDPAGLAAWQDFCRMKEERVVAP